MHHHRYISDEFGYLVKNQFAANRLRLPDAVGRTVTLAEINAGGMPTAIKRLVKRGYVEIIKTGEVAAPAPTVEPVTAPEEIAGIGLSEDEPVPETPYRRKRPKKKRG